MAVAFQSSGPSAPPEATYFRNGCRTSPHGPDANGQQLAKPAKLLRPTSIAASSVSNKDLAASSWSPTATNQSPTSMTPSTVSGRVDQPRHLFSPPPGCPAAWPRKHPDPRLSVLAAEEAA